MKHMLLAATAALLLGTAVGAGPAAAQYDGEDDGDRRAERRYERRDRDIGRDFGEERYERRRVYRDDDGFERPRGRRAGRGGFGGRGVSVCVTARGTCVTRPAPYNTACGCELPGFGFKRGQIGG